MAGIRVSAIFKLVIIMLGQIIGAGISAISNHISQAQQHEYQKELAKIQQEYNKENMAIQQGYTEKNMGISQQYNVDNMNLQSELNKDQYQYEALNDSVLQAQSMKNAGFNPAMLSSPGSSASVGSVGMPSAPSGQAGLPSVGQGQAGILPIDLLNFAQAKLLNTQADNIEADTKLKKNQDQLFGATFDNMVKSTEYTTLVQKYNLENMLPAELDKLKVSTEETKQNIENLQQYVTESISKSKLNDADRQKINQATLNLQKEMEQIQQDIIESKSRVRLNNSQIGLNKHLGGYYDKEGNLAVHRTWLTDNQNVNTKIQNAIEKYDYECKSAIDPKIRGLRDFTIESAGMAMDVIGSAVNSATTIRNSNTHRMNAQTNRMNAKTQSRVQQKRNR